MKTAILIDQDGLAEAHMSSFNHENTQWIAVDSVDRVAADSTDLVVFMQVPNAIPAHWKMPVLINDTTGTFQLPAQDNRPIARFCGWNTMIERSTWEIAMYNQASTDWMQGVEVLLNKKLYIVSNTPGFIAPRVVATIINEACYGLADQICTANDLDLAMRLGTNYPRGPIAWMKEIGKENILTLLNTLALEEERYKPHPLLHSEKLL